MRRLLFLCLVLVLSCLALASAANLEVDGGVLQVFDVGIELDPTSFVTETSTTIEMDYASTTIAPLESVPSNELSEAVDTGSP